MEEKKFVGFKKEEFRVKEYIKNMLGKGKISSVTIEYTPVGEKIIVATSRPGLVIGRRGEKIAEMTRILKKNFSLDNPHIDIAEIHEPMLDARLVADDIAMMIERKGSLKFKVVAYKTMQQIIKAGALGTEIVLSGKLPSERARRWRFSHGYLKKTGDPAKVVDIAQAQAITPLGVVGVQVSILRPDAEMHDSIVINDEAKRMVKSNALDISSGKEKKEEETKSKKERKPKSKEGK